MHPCNSTQVGVQSVTDSIDPDEYGVDEEGPLPLEMDCDDDVVVPWNHSSTCRKTTRCFSTGCGST